MVKVGDTIYSRNRRHIQKTNELPIAVHPDNLATPPDPSSEAPSLTMKKTLISGGLVVSAEHWFGTRTM